MDLSFATIGIALLAALVPILGFVQASQWRKFDKIHERADKQDILIAKVQTSMHNTVSEDQVRQIIEDKLAPVRVDCTHIKDALSDLKITTNTLNDMIRQVLQGLNQQ